MFLPLGFGGRFPRFPWVTTLLCLSIYLSHAFYGRYLMDDYGKFYQKTLHNYLAHENMRLEATNICKTKVLPNYFSDDAKKVLSDKSIKACDSILSESYQFDFNKSKASFSSGISAEQYIRILFSVGLSNIKEIEENSIMSNLLSEFLNEIFVFQKNEDLLSPRNNTPVALFKAQFLHSDWMHLFGNLLALFLVGCLVECRRSPWIMLPTYFVGAIIGFLLNNALEKNSFTILVGASAGVSAVAGLFTAYFYKFRMKFLMFIFPPFYKTFHANSIIILPITFFALDLLNGLSNADAPVAYWAHFGGAIFGLSVGLFAEKTKPIHWPMLYAFEEDIIKNISQTVSPHDRIHKSINLLRSNPENIQVIESLCLDTIHLLRSGIPNTKEYSEVLSLHLPTLISVYGRHKKQEQAFQLITQVPVSVSLHSVLERTSQPNLINALKWSKENQHIWTFLRLYSVWTERFASSQKLRSAKLEISEALGLIEMNPINFRKLLILRDNLPEHSMLQNEIYKYLHALENTNELDDERKNAA